MTSGAIRPARWCDAAIRMLLSLSVVGASASCSWLGSGSTLERFAEGDTEGFLRVSLDSDFDVRTGADVVLVGVPAEAAFDGELTVWDEDIADACRDVCRDRLDEVAALLRHPDATPTVRGFLCGNCPSAEAVVVVDLSGARARIVAQDEIVGLVAPIDTAYEALLAHPVVTAFREVDDGWEYVSVEYLDCGPADVTYQLWHLDAEGTKREVDTYVKPADSDQEAWCA